MSLRPAGHRPGGGRRRRRPHPALIVALAATLGTAGTGVLLSSEAFAAAAPPPLEVITSGHQTIERYEGEGLYIYGLGLYVRAGDSPVEIRTTRPASYTEPVKAELWSGGAVSRKLKDVPAGLITDVNTLTRFATLTLKDSKGKTVSTSAQNFCPNSYEAARARPTGPARSPYPTSCGYHPFALGGVLGIQDNWSVPSLSDYYYGGEDESSGVPDGDYTATYTIRSGYRALLGIPAKSATATLAFTVKTVENPWEDGGAGTAPAGRTGLAAAAAASSHDHSATAVPVDELSPQGRKRAEALKRSYGTAETPAARAPVTASAAARGVAGAAAAVPKGPKPDLRSLPANGISLSDGDDYDPDTPVVPGKTYLTFNATIWNAGPSPLVVDGFRRPGTGLMDAYQYFFDAQGNQTGYTSAGTLEWDPREGHNHWHFTAFGTYRLLNADKTKAIRSDKEAFCLAATDPVDLTLKGAEYKPGSTDLSTACGGESALSLREQLDAGWGDTYGQYLPGQSFDVSDVPNGTYWVEVRANPDGKLAESSSTNNVSLRKVVLGGKPGGTRTVTTPPVGLIDAP